MPPLLVLTLILDGGLHDLGLADLLHQFGYAALLDELRADVFGEGDELLHLRRIGEKAGQKVEALDEAGQQVDERPCGRRMSVSFAWNRVRSPLTENCTWASVPVAATVYEIGGILLGEHACRQDLRVQLRAKLLIRFVRLEGRALAILGERLEDRRGVVGEVHDHDVLLPLVATVQSRHRLHGVAIHHRFVEEHAGQQAAGRIRSGTCWPRSSAGSRRPRTDLRSIRHPSAH